MKAVFYKRIYALFATVLILLSLFGGQVVHIAVAEEREYSNVLVDLQKDKSFNSADYPTIEDKTNEAYASVQVIQIAESEHGELFVYTYEPSADVLSLEITSIAMWTKFSNNGKDFTPIIYKLKNVSKSGVFSKYVVENYTVADEVERYYNFSAIYRKFNSEIDEELVDGIRNEIAISIGQQWCAYWYNDEIVYEMNTFETLELTVTFNGTLEFEDGFTLGSLSPVIPDSYGASHFIAFNAENYVIQHIYDADVFFRVRSVIDNPLLPSPSYGSWEEKTLFLSDADEGIYRGVGLFSSSYKWNRISSAEEFITTMKNQDVSISESLEDTLKKSQWVFSFYESKVEYVDDTNTWNPTDKYKNRYSEVDDVTVLRVHFMDINHKIYNLGAIMDKTSSDNIVDGIGDSPDLFDFLEDILLLLAILAGGIGILFILVLIAPLLPYVGKGILWVLLLPFKLIGLLFKGIGLGLKKLFGRDDDEY